MDRPRLTAQFILSVTDIALAYACPRYVRGPNGETDIACLLRTRDAGAQWQPVSWRRGFIDRIRHGGFPVWPPEAVISLAGDQSQLEVTFRDEWVPFEPGGESLWRAHRPNGGTWKVQRIRLMDYDGEDTPAKVPDVQLELPRGASPPDIAMFDEAFVTRLANL